MFGYFKVGACDTLEKLVEDESYASLLMANSINSLRRCKRFYDCNVVAVPYVVYQTLGAGWIFPKQSPLLPIFNHYVTSLKEIGTINRIEGSYDDRKGMPGQICPNYDGHPINAEKSFSLFVLMLIGFGFAMICLW